MRRSEKGALPAGAAARGEAAMSDHHFQLSEARLGRTGFVGETRRDFVVRSGVGNPRATRQSGLTGSGSVVSAGGVRIACRLAGDNPVEPRNSARDPSHMFHGSSPAVLPLRGGTGGVQEVEGHGDQQPAAVRRRDFLHHHAVGAGADPVVGLAEFLPLVVEFDDRDPAGDAVAVWRVAVGRPDCRPRVVGPVERLRRQRGAPRNPA